MLKKILHGLMSMLIMPITIQAQSDLNATLTWEPNRVKKEMVVINEHRSETQLPIYVVNGKQSGPTMAIVAGIHGFEYPPIMAVQELISEIETEQLSGQLIIIPIANRASFYYRTPFVNPLDGKNLNLVFPGDPKGTSTEQLAHLITTEVISRSNYFIDIHGGDANECLLPFICYYNRTDDMLSSSKAEALTKVAGFANVVVYPFDLKAGQAARYAMKQAVQQGVVTVSLEAGKLGGVQKEEVERLKQAVYNMLAYSDMYNTPIKVKEEVEHVYDKQTYLKSHLTGIFHSELKSGDTVKEGDIIAHITDEFGDVISEISSPTDGVILYKIGTPPVNVGETMFCIVH